ncbi:hypothetical protein PAPYR_1655 [Paratrimastix pyriformis]|uniref:RING-type domain-containing protein n=1 Tax=Paratrimastix pyriformis TaxID=342808 RepID=A0ABQ8US53_9EUKA|nr:hypothetical protein PAPYR_1655 [Paratrimastix pyriformis]
MEQEGFPTELFAQTIPDVMVCPICQCVMRQAVTLMCQGSHKACEACCERWIKTQGASVTCPCCRQELIKPHFNRDPYFNSLIQQLAVHCPQPPCEWQGKLEDLARHQTHECSYREAQGTTPVCPAGRTRSPARTATSRSHRAQCPEALQTCPVPGCDAKVARCRLENHLATAPDPPHLARLQAATKAALDACRADLARSAAAQQHLQGVVDVLKKQLQQVAVLLANPPCCRDPATGSISLRAIRQKLEEHFGMDLSAIRDTIKEIVQRLVPQLFWALREALAELEMTHRTEVPPCPPSSQSPFFFAASDLKGLGQLEIVSRMGGSQCCFKARIIPSKTAGGVAAALPVVLKIAAGDYGLAAHQAAFAAGFAPALIACYRLPSLDPIPIPLRPHPAPTSTVSPPLLAAINSATAAAAAAAAAATRPSHVLVIMEELTDCQPWYALDPDLRLALAGPLKDAVARFHAEGWVHGDLRDINVGATMAPAPRLVIVDYDWSGPVGVATYPPFLNHEIGWPEGAVSGGLITRQHDDDWVEHLTFVARV